jgi:hypothetical protein
MEALSEIDSALANLGVRRQIRSVLVPGKAFTVTYDGPTIDRKQLEATLSPVAERRHISFSVELEESVSFP